MAVAEESPNEQQSVRIEEENGAGKRGREQDDDGEGERGTNKNPKIEADDDDGKKEECPVEVILGPKTFGSSEEMFNYFHQLVHYKWTTDLDFNKYEYMVIMDLLKKGHVDPESKIGGGIKAFQVRSHPLFKSKCLFIVREDGSTDDFSFRKCVDKILPIPENMKPSSNNKFGLGRGGRGGRGGGGRGRRGATLPDEPKPPIILHYNVQLHGDMTTGDPIIVQNTWTASQDWGAEERCPDSNEVKDVEMCNKILNSRNSSNSKKKGNFPFKQGYLAIATLRVGHEGIRMIVDGEHITSFAYRKNLEPWLVSELRISGDIKLTSIFATGLPVSEELDSLVDLEKLKASPLPPHKDLVLFIGIISSANNFNHRMAIRRTWLQYVALNKSGSVAARFFVGLHKKQMVNEELWNEAQIYGDIQLMPFIDYYSLLTWKTIGICIYGTNIVSAKYILKTDDDSFVRVDQILNSLKTIGTTSGLLYGFITSNSQPDRTNGSNWYVSSEVLRGWFNYLWGKWLDEIMQIIIMEDVAMGIWIAETKKKGKKVNYVNEERIDLGGCEHDGFVIAHYQGPRNMLCLWNKLIETNQATCCK